MATQQIGCPFPMPNTLRSFRPNVIKAKALVKGNLAVEVKKDILMQNVFMADRLSSCLLAARCSSPRSSTIRSHPLLKPYENQLDTTVDPKCPSCGEGPQTVEHWLQRCPNAVALGQKLFGEPSPPLSVLTTNPGGVLVLARKTLL